MATVYTRLLDDLLAELALITGPVPGLVSDELKAPHQLTDLSKFPAIFVELASEGEQAAERQERGRVVEATPVDVWGYVRTAQATGTGRQREREAWLAKVWNSLTGPAMQTRVVTTMAANAGNGCSQIRPGGGAVRDEGEETDSPYGIFRLPMLAIMHYPWGGM